jgi:hypothetical protein
MNSPKIPDGDISSLVTREPANPDQNSKAAKIRAKRSGSSSQTLTEPGAGSPRTIDPQLIRDRIKELRRVPASSLLSNPKNWRRHPLAQVDVTRDLLTTIGYVDALLAREVPDGSLMLIDGHLRKDITPDAIVPVLIVKVTEEEADILLLTLNPVAANAETDSARIQALIETVGATTDAVGELLRRTAGDNIWQRIYPQELIEPPAQIDQAAELQKWTTRPGQLWGIGQHRLLCGDSTVAEDVIRLMGDDRAVLVLPH